MHSFVRIGSRGLIRFWLFQERKGIPDMTVAGSKDHYQCTDTTGAPPESPRSSSTLYAIYAQNSWSIREA
ncbi:hypothetical protein N7461_004578 [Penicillium sp. DV-2018c]|nr:hypothetical protein N7461_004578 [Penicillium sp. DV-2018c]